MEVRKLIDADDGPVEAILKAPERSRVAGKYLVGRSILDSGRLSLVFDASAEFHKDIAQEFSLRPLGGGWCEIDHTACTLRVSSSSQAFGREPDRQRALAWFRECLPGYDCESAE